MSEELRLGKEKNKLVLKKFYNASFLAQPEGREKRPKDRLAPESLRTMRVVPMHSFASHVCLHAVARPSPLPDTPSNSRPRKKRNPSQKRVPPTMHTLHLDSYSTAALPLQAPRSLSVSPATARATAANYDLVMPDRTNRHICFGSASMVVVVVVVLKVRGVTVDESVSVLVEAVKDPKPHQASHAIRPTFVEHTGLVQRQPLVRDARSAAPCGSERWRRRKRARVSERACGWVGAQNERVVQEMKG